MNNPRNSVQLIGHLGADPEMKTLENNSTMAKLRLATSESYKSASGDWKEETQWHRVTVWEALAERVGRQLTKGSFVLIQGKLMNKSYTDAQGIKRYVTEIRATSVIPLDKNKLSENTPLPDSPVMTDDDLPF
ncbi:MAG TPA: single-stranded DNA-binding protein [Flavipsychrobacter sp.]|nr:single-stranded DNA-binding protein [Flavipsychrobacter sp.]